MEKIKIREEVIKDVEDILDTDKTKTEEKPGTIIFDGKQYSIKIPKKIAEKVRIHPEKDKFIFEIKTYPLEEEKIPSLTITLKRG